MNCPVLTKKRFYGCDREGCKTHYWLCDNPDHVRMNKKKAESSWKYWNNFGIRFHLEQSHEVKFGVSAKSHNPVAKPAPGATSALCDREVM